MDELQPSEKFAGTVMIQTGFHHYETDRARVLTADAPSLASVAGFQDRVSKAVKNQGPRNESCGIVFNQEDGLHGAAKACRPARALSRATRFVG